MDLEDIGTVTIQDITEVVVTLVTLVITPNLIVQAPPQDHLNHSRSEITALLALNLVRSRNSINAVEAIYLNHRIRKAPHRAHPPAIVVRTNSTIAMLKAILTINIGPVTNPAPMSLILARTIA